MESPPQAWWAVEFQPEQSSSRWGNLGGAGLERGAPPTRHQGKDEAEGRKGLRLTRGEVGDPGWLTEAAQSDLWVC